MLYIRTDTTCLRPIQENFIGNLLHGQALKNIPQSYSLSNTHRHRNATWQESFQVTLVPIVTSLLVSTSLFLFLAFVCFASFSSKLLLLLFRSDSPTRIRVYCRRP